MNKNRKLLKFAISALVIISAVGSTTVTASSINLQSKIETLKEQFNSQKSDLEKTGVYSTTSNQAKAVKSLGIQIADLSEQTKTEEDYRRELESFIAGVKCGLADTKEEQKVHYVQENQDFIDKTEKKLADIEAQMKINDKKKNNNNIALDSSLNSISNERPSKELLERLEDRSDVDN